MDITDKKAGTYRGIENIVIILPYGVFTPRHLCLLGCVAASFQLLKKEKIKSITYNIIATRPRERAKSQRLYVSILKKCV